jgi:hypothetical protein
MPAIERYNGPMWQLLRKFLSEEAEHSRNLEVYGLSAEFGLIPANQPIPMYDREMSEERALELRPRVMEKLKLMLTSGYSRLCLGLSQRYMFALDGWDRWVPTELPVTVTDGPMGVKLAQLKAWLYGKPWQPDQSQSRRLKTPRFPQGKATIKGITLEFTPNDVFEQARLALAQGDKRAYAYREWYVLLDGQRVSPKWLVSLISGQPTSNFDAGAARRVLTALGIDVKHISEQ